jgi:hypothetical protein
MMGKDNPDCYRSDTFFTDRRLLVWEYPATRPKGDQLDVVESPDIENGLIAYHRVDWGWRGYELLTRHGLVADVNPRSGSKASTLRSYSGYHWRRQHYARGSGIFAVPQFPSFQRYRPEMSAGQFWQRNGG